MRKISFNGRWTERKWKKTLEKTIRGFKRENLSDEVIARALGISVETVRAVDLQSNEVAK